nr:MAG TPA: hypothetical protein [Caudoviricetes sp.]
MRLWLPGTGAFFIFIIHLLHETQGSRHLEFGLKPL